MKKFLLSLCMLAVASACVFMASCKDDDELARAKVSGTLEQVVNNEMRQHGVSYTFQLDGQIYNSYSAFAEAVAALPAGSNHTMSVTMVDKNGNAHKGDSVSFTVPASGSVTVPVDVPVHNADHSDGATVVIAAPSHSGGRV